MLPPPIADGEAQWHSGARLARVFASLSPDLRSGFLVPAPDIPIALDLADVVGKAIHHPLRVHFALSAKAESPEPHGVTDVGEHRLHRPQAPAVAIAAFVGIDLALHALGAGLRLALVSPQDKSHLPCRSSEGSRPQRVRQNPLRLVKFSSALMD